MELTDGQAQIFWYIYAKPTNRVQVIAPTQYGKSNTIAMALLLRTQKYKEDFAIVTGEQKKSEIIMGKMIDHLFDNPMLLDNLELDRNEPIERIRRERSKAKITWKSGGSVTTVTADARNRRNVTRSLSGLGAPNIIEDEASLIPDDLQAMVLRMLGGYNGGFLMKIGNPYVRNHFYRTSQSEHYAQVFIDYHQGLKEGRYTKEFIEEMRQEAFFNVLYECVFPDQNELDSEGYRQLLTGEQIQTACKGVKSHEGGLLLGFDIGEGGDETVGVLRSNTKAEVVHYSKVADMMGITGIIVNLINQHKIPHGNVSVDATGIGAGVEDRLKELGYYVNGVKWGNKATNDTFANLKAENYWHLREWIGQHGTLAPHPKWDELQGIKYRYNSSGKILIKSKEEMRKEGIPSPNVADAFALTFNKTIEETAPQVWTL